MASVLEYVLSGELLVDALVSFLKRDLCDTGFVPKENIPTQLTEFQHIHQEFIPFFLNYLRDQTIHLLQSSKSATPSPAKTPSAQKLKKSISEKKGSSSSKRIQLFGASPGDGIDDIKPTSGSFFSPNTSIDAKPPTLNTPTNEGIVGKDKKSTPKGHCSVERNQNFSSVGGSSVDRDHRSKGSRNTTPHSGSKNNQDGRSRHRFSLGEFIISPEVTCTSANKRKNSPYSSGRRNDKSDENSPSPAPTNLKSGNKKRHSVESGSRRSCSPAPVFSLGNTDEFPPVGGDGKPVTPRMHDLAVEKGNLTNMILKNSPNFDNTPRAVKSNPITKSRRISFTTIPQEGSSESPAPPSIRRINPTPVSGKPFRRQTNAFIEQQDSENKGSSSSFDQSHLEEERELLRKEKAKHLQNKVESKSDDCSSASCSTPTKLALDRSVSTVDIVTADIKEVTHKIELDKLVQLYSECLSENLFPNLSMELYFLMQLLTTRSVDLELIAVCGEDVLENNFFCSVHNAVYFAVGVLQEQKRLLQCLDKVTLRLLSENTRISHFSPDLSNWLLTIVESKNQQVGPIYPKSPIGSVSFQAETDNRKNFPDDRTFHLFKKQRDGFYEILREWETHHMMPGWSVSEVLGNKIRALVSSKTELSNHLHFARLFQSQLIAMCKGDSGLMAETGDDNIALLSQLKRSNPEKFKKLQERFSKPLSFGGPCPVPAFPGCQEFFHDFIIAASSTIFNQHLSDTFASKILELNSICFLPEEETGNEDSDDEQKELFLSSLFTLRLLGKFLGFVTFLPYQTTTKLPDEMEVMYLSIRKNHLPYLDLVECIKEALSLHRLTLTIPWVVEFLSMMDVVAPKIDHFQLTLFLLLLIHRSCWRELKHENYSCLLIVTMISWLLDLSVIPEGFFVEIPNDVVDILPIVQRKSTYQLDTMGFIDQSVFYSCCPYLLELRTLLTEFAVGCSSKTSTIRKITPVSADDTSIPKPSDVQIQLQLEENFFHNHPASLRRCVDFVAERTASNFIKRFRSTSLQKSLRDSREALNTHLMSQSGGSPSGKAKDKLQHDILKIAQDHVAQAKVMVAENVGSYCEERIKALVPLLLPDEQSDSVKQTSSGIATRMSQEKVHSWINRHITVQMFQSELTLELDRILKSQLLNQTRATTTGSEMLIPVNAESSFEVIAGEHDDNTRLPSEVLIDIKDMMKLIILKNVNPGRKAVKDLLMETKIILERRQDWLPGIFRSYGQLVKDLYLSLFCHFPEEWNIEDIKDFEELWIGPLKSAIPLSTVVCSYSLRMVEESPNPKLAWTNFENLLLLLIQQTLLTTSELQQNCLNILAETQDSIENLAVCLCHIMEKLDLDPEFTEECELGDILEWIYQICGAKAPVSKYILQTLKLDVPPGQVIVKPSSEQVQTFSTAKCDQYQKDKDSESESKTVHSVQENKDGDSIRKCSQNSFEQMDRVHVNLESMAISVKDNKILVHD